MRLANAAVLLLLCGAIPLSPAWGQRLTPAGPLAEVELITLARDVPMDQALRVIQTFSSRVIVDPEHRTEPIGVDVDRLPWREALEAIARKNGSEVVVQERYIELRRLATAGGPPPEVSLDSREVNIVAIFFQADQTALQEMGIDWSTLSGGRVDIKVGHQGASQTSGGPFEASVAGNLTRSISVDLLLRTFESQDSGEIIARPQIKVRSGKTGQIQVGSDFSVTTSDYAGNAITQFYQTGTILKVEPVIRTEDDIDYVDLLVEAERSSLLDISRNVVSKTTARTTALLRDGEQTAIAGLYGQEIGTTRSGVPVLKNLPPWFLGLRYLFGYDSRMFTKTELIVLLQVDILPSVRQRVQADLRRGEAPAEPPPAASLPWPRPDRGVRDGE